MNIHLHIDRLIVDGLPLTPPQAHALRANVEAQLAALFTAAPLHHASGYSVPTLPVAPIAWNARTENTAGQSIARALHSALVPNANSARSTR